MKPTIPPRSEALTCVRESPIQDKQNSPISIKAVEIYVDNYLSTEIVQDNDRLVLDKSREILKQ